MTPECLTQLRYLQSRLSTPAELIAYRHHYQHQAEIQERDWPVLYAGLALALEQWVLPQLSERERGIVWDGRHFKRKRGRPAR
jgi:hypothetical protein